VSALFYLFTRSLANSLIHRFKRLRQPKYLLGLILAGTYIYFYFYRFLFAEFRSAKLIISPEEQELWRNIGAGLLLSATLALSWILPSSRATINFSEAEIALLFPAPITRRRLVIFKILRSQVALLIISAFFTFVSGRWRTGIDAWTRTGSWWIILNTLSLHRIGASFALSRLHQRGLSDWKRRLAFLAAVAALCAVVYYTWREMPGLRPSKLPKGADPLTPYLNQFLTAGPMPWLLAPFKLVVAPFFAHGAMPFFAALPAALGILGLHFLWVVRADASFEDAAIESAQKRSALLAAARKGEVRVTPETGKARIPLFTLRPLGPQATAFLWKSFIRAGGRRTLGRWATFFIALAAGSFWLSHQNAESPTPAVVTLSIIIGTGCYFALLLSFVLVGQQAAGQLRQGIAGMDLLKTYPLPGWQFALGELLGPVLMGTAIQWIALSIGTTLAITLATAHAADAAQPILLGAGGLALFLPLFNLGSAILPAAAALAFPGWMKPGDASNAAQGGLEVMGLRLLLGISQLLLIALAFLPVAFFGAAAWFASGMFTDVFAWKVGSVVASAGFIVLLEAAAGIAWLGWLFERFDLSGE